MSLSILLHVPLIKYRFWNIIYVENFEIGQKIANFGYSVANINPHNQTEIEFTINSKEPNNKGHIAIIMLEFQLLCTI